MTRRIVLVVFLLGWGFALTPDSAHAAPDSEEGESHQDKERVEVPRIAVLDTGNANALCDLLEVELSQLPGIELLERRELSALGAETSLSNLMSSSGIVRVGDMLGAEGLVFASEDEDARSVHLVAVEPGARLVSEFRQPKADDPGKDAAAAVAAFSPHIETLRAIARDEAIPVSLLGVNFSMASEEVVRLERQLNTLLARRLTRLPGVLVLERWDLARLQWDHSLKAEAGSFWTGSRMLDGEVVRKNGRWHARIRLREAPAAEGTIFQVSVPKGDIAHLGEKIARAAGEKLSIEKKETAAWDPIDEANQYARLGQWAYFNASPEIVIEALETAFALGYRGSQAKQMLMYSYMRVAKQRDWNQDDRLAFCIRRNEMYRDFLSNPEELYRMSKDGKKVDSDTAGLPTRYFQPIRLPDFWGETLKVLKTSYENGAARTHARQLAVIRGLYRANYLTKDKRLPKYFGYTPYWTETPEQTIQAYYEYLSFPPPPMESKEIHFRHSLFQYRRNRTWLISWEGKDQEHLDKLWEAFVNKLRTSSDIGLRADGIVLYFSLAREDERRALLPKIVRFLYKHRKAMADWNQKPYPTGFLKIMTRYVDKLDEENKKIYFKYIRFILSNPPKLGENVWFKFEKSVQNSQIEVFCKSWNNNQASELYKIAERQLNQLLNELDSLKYPARWHANVKKRILTEILDKLPKKHPQLRAEIKRKTATKKSQKDIGKNKNNILRLDTYFDIPQESYATVSSVQVFDNNLWITIRQQQKLRIMIFDTETAQTSKFSCKGITDFQKLQVAMGPDTLWVIADDEKLYFRPRNGKRWSSVDIPPYSYGDMTEIDGVVYVICQAEGFGEGVLSIDPKTGDTNWILSSRRKPARNNLDGTQFGKPLSLFASGAGRLCMMTDKWLFERELHGADWKRPFMEQAYSRGYRRKYIRHFSLRQCTEDDRGAYLRSGLGILWYAPDADGYEFLLKDPRKLKGIAGSRWEVEYGKYPYSLCATTTDGKDLWILGSQGKGKEKKWTLQHYRKGEPSPRAISLSFRVPAEELKHRTKQLFHHFVGSIDEDINQTKKLLKNETYLNKRLQGKLKLILRQRQKRRARRIKQLSLDTGIQIEHIAAVDDRLFFVNKHGWSIWSIPIKELQAFNPDSQ